MSALSSASSTSPSAEPGFRGRVTGVSRIRSDGTLAPSIQRRASATKASAREAVDPREAARGVVAEHFDPTARQFVTALGKLYPQAPEGALVDAYLFMVGALVMTMAAGDRASRLDQPREAVPVVENAEHLLQRLTSFCAAGIDGLLRGR